MNWLLHLLKTPSSYPDDPRGYAINQLGHGYAVGGAITVFLLLAFRGLADLGITPPPDWVAAVIVAMNYAWWEGVQLGFFGSTWSDSLEDFTHVALVAGAFGLGLWWLLGVQLVLLTVGIALRDIEGGWW